MQTAYWGTKGGAWGLISSIALNYPELDPSIKQKKHAVSFLYSLMRVLPCGFCRDSSLEYIKDLPPEPFLNDRAGFCIWVYLFHHRVNEKLSKRSCSFNTFIGKHEKFRAKCSKGLGCTIPAVKCPQEIDDWCDYALNKYSNYQQLIDDWKQQQKFTKFSYIVLSIVLLIFIIWSVLPRLRQIFKTLNKK